MGMGKSFARKQLLVDKEVQRALVWQLFRQWATFLAVLAAMLVVLQALSQGPAMSLSGALVQTLRSNAALLVVIVVLFPVFLYDSLKLSNRFAGPIFRLRRAMRQAAENPDAPPLKFRTGDYWQEVADDFNALVRHLEKKPAAGDQPPLPNAVHDSVT